VRINRAASREEKESKRDRPRWHEIVPLDGIDRNHAERQAREQAFKAADGIQLPAFDRSHACLLRAEIARSGFSAPCREKRSRRVGRPRRKCLLEIGSARRRSIESRELPRKSHIASCELLRPSYVTRSTRKSDSALWKPIHSRDSAEPNVVNNVAG